MLKTPSLPEILNITIIKDMLKEYAKEKLKGEYMDALFEVINKEIANEASFVMKKAEQRYNEITDLYEILDKLILSDNEILRDLGVFMLERISLHGEESGNHCHTVDRKQLLK